MPLPALATSALGAAALGFSLRIQGAAPAGIPITALLASGGTVATLSGILWLVLTYRRPPEQAPSIPAHVAFHTRKPRIMTPDQPERTVMKAPRPASPTALRLAEMDREIRELTRQISKAGVLLATGKLSQEGYIHYVDELKSRRGKIEATRVHLQLKG